MSNFPAWLIKYWAFMDKADAQIEPTEEAVLFWIGEHLLICAILLALFLGYIVIRVESAKWDKKIEEARRKIHGEEE